MIPLSDLPIGHSGKIARVAGSSETFQRLRDLGLIEGEVVRMLKRAPLGDPIEVRIMNYNLCLRLSEAREIKVKRNQSEK